MLKHPHTYKRPVFAKALWITTVTCIVLGLITCFFPWTSDAIPLLPGEVNPYFYTYPSELIYPFVYLFIQMIFLLLFFSRKQIHQVLAIIFLIVTMVFLRIVSYFSVMKLHIFTSQGPDDVVLWPGYVFEFLNVIFFTALIILGSLKEAKQRENVDLFI